MRPSKNPIRHTGLSIISTLNQSDAVRRDLATDLLLRSQRPIKQIAAEVGFQLHAGVQALYGGDAGGDEVPGAVDIGITRQTRPIARAKDRS
jgi:hypothetical protein